MGWPFEELAIDGTLYWLGCDRANSVFLSSTKFEPTRRKLATNIVSLGYLVHFSSLYANRCRIFLILGETDNDDMHVLMVPEEDGAPEMKTIPLTWAEARAILDRKWEDQYGYVESGQD